MAFVFVYDSPWLGKVKLLKQIVIENITLSKITINYDASVKKINADRLFWLLMSLKTYITYECFRKY